MELGKAKESSPTQIGRPTKAYGRMTRSIGEKIKALEDDFMEGPGTYTFATGEVSRGWYKNYEWGRCQTMSDIGRYSWTWHDGRCMGSLPTRMDGLMS
jgi:hypothetical protein